MIIIQLYVTDHNCEKCKRKMMHIMKPIMEGNGNNAISKLFTDLPQLGTQLQNRRKG